MLVSVWRFISLKSICFTKLKKDDVFTVWLEFQIEKYFLKLLTVSGYALEVEYQSSQCKETGGFPCCHQPQC